MFFKGTELCHQGGDSFPYYEKSHLFYERTDLYDIFSRRNQSCIKK